MYIFYKKFFNFKLNLIFIKLLKILVFYKILNNPFLSALVIFYFFVPSLASIIYPNACIGNNYEFIDFRWMSPFWIHTVIKKINTSKKIHITP